MTITLTFNCPGISMLRTYIMIFFWTSDMCSLVKKRLMLLKERNQLLWGGGLSPFMIWVNSFPSFATRVALFEIFKWLWREPLQMLAFVPAFLKLISIYSLGISNATRLMSLQCQSYIRGSSGHVALNQVYPDDRCLFPGQNQPSEKGYITQCWTLNPRVGYLPQTPAPS